MHRLCTKVTLYNVVIFVVTAFSIWTPGNNEEMSRIVKYVWYSQFPPSFPPRLFVIIQQVGTIFFCGISTLQHFLLLYIVTWTQHTSATAHLL
jgi:hypothetical protein